MNFRPGRADSDEPRIEITPLVDVVFLLLIFFLLTTSFVTQPSIEVDLPESGEPPAQPAETEDLVVALTAEGRWLYEGRDITPEALREVFEEAAARRPETTVQLQADEAVAHREVVRVMDLARRSGLGRLAIVTESGARAP